MSACCGPERETGEPIPGRSSDATTGGTPDLATLGIDMVTIPGGTFAMGTDDPRGYPGDGEGPVHEVDLDPFTIGRTAITNDQFAAFADATGYRTSAEQYGDSFVFAGLLPDDFPPTQAVAAALWWRVVEGACWRHPEGPHSDTADRGDHPAVHISWLDATAFCEWAGARLPTEAEWERAARGGTSGQHFWWGHDHEPDGEHLMNVFQGTFPGTNTVADGHVGTCPVGAFGPNPYGLHEVLGNVWEWCHDWFDPGYYARSPRENPTGPDSGTNHVMRGGSYLCHESYCWRYRVDARSANGPDSSTGNLGFRIAL